MTARWLGSINSTDAKHLPKPRSPSSVIPLARCPSDDGALLSSLPFWFPKEIRPQINQTFLDASTPTLYSGPRTGLTSQLTARSLTPRGASSTGSLPPVHHRSPSPERRRSASPPVRADKARRARDVNGSRVGLFVGTPDKISRQIDSGLAEYDQALRISVPPSPRSEQLRLPPANPYSDGAYPVLRSRAEPMPAIEGGAGMLLVHNASFSARSLGAPRPRAAPPPAPRGAAPAPHSAAARRFVRGGARAAGRRRSARSCGARRRRSRRSRGRACRPPGPSGHLRSVARRSPGLPPPPRSGSPLGPHRAPARPAGGRPPKCHRCGCRRRSTTPPAARMPPRRLHRAGLAAAPWIRAPSTRTSLARSSERS